jgi:hypothetical protein
MSGGQAFMFTPDGAIPIPQEGIGADFGGINPEEVSGAALPSSLPAKQAPQQTHLALPATVASTVTRGESVARAALSRGEVVKAARARIKDIRAELRHMKALERELAELERLVAAAKKPVAIVRNIEQARHAR